VPPYEEILNKGLKFFRDESEQRLTDLDFSDPDQAGKETFYQAMIIILMPSSDTQKACFKSSSARFSGK